MKTPRPVLFFTLILLGLAGCVTPLIPANEDVSNLHQRFHGKYKAIRSQSSEAIDVNLDAQASTDMLVEIPELAKLYQNYLELRIYPPDKYRASAVYLFTQWWPEQDIFMPTNKTQGWEGEDMPYQPGLTVNYPMQGTPRNFTFSADLKQIIVSSHQNENSFRWVRPESVVVEETNRIRIVNNRRLYTRGGVKEVVITTVYERFTMTT